MHGGGKLPFQALRNTQHRFFIPCFYHQGGWAEHLIRHGVIGQERIRTCSQHDRPGRAVSGIGFHLGQRLHPFLGDHRIHRIVIS